MICATPAWRARSRTSGRSSRNDECVRLAPMSTSCMPSASIKLGGGLLSGELVREAADLAQRALLALGPRLAEREAHAVAVTLRGREHRPGRNGDAALDQPLEQGDRVAAFRQLDPDDVGARRPRDARAARERLGDYAARPVDLRLEAPPQAA